jgi:hypothetical protein
MKQNLAYDSAWTKNKTQNSINKTQNRIIIQFLFFANRVLYFDYEKIRPNFFRGAGAD